MAKVLLVTGDAAESLEVMYPYQRMLEEGYTVKIAAPTAKRLQFVVHDFVEGFDTYTEKLGYTWPADVAFKDVRPEEYDALIIPGGRAPEYIRMDPDARRIVRHFAETNKPIAAICHAAQLLAAADVLSGRRAACYPAVSPELTKAGGTFVDDAAVVDGEIVSARAWPDHPQWMRAFVKLLRERVPAGV
ncbi:MAG TPA: DJ-1/PfpI family protein [Candidatus Dormibacteraeota bacterium]|nr:DJ-1/PfpI family protein [Candidatus Dormibacteraeota bacterium]